ncbi:g6808 [Coccomyxa viridis]|uniref:adenylate kinase n=1 Tax=Coccomyxa viridis TaxID=1274662 RepID=A0ABP1FWB0_9CHLO
MLQRAKLIARVAQEAGLTAAQLNAKLEQPSMLRRTPAWVFLGPPGVGKGTYASRVADALGLAHISAGDLVREEIKQQTDLGQQVATIVNQGNLLPDQYVMQLLQNRLSEGARKGEEGVLLDGFPRTRNQAEALLTFADVQLALNLSLREEVLIAKCLARRKCRDCGKNYNLADIDLPASEGKPAIRMPPLLPPAACAAKLETRSDDNFSTVKRRIEVHKAEASPVEDIFRKAGVLSDFEITGGIPETFPRLLETLQSGSLTQDREQAA